MAEMIIITPVFRRQQVICVIFRNQNLTIMKLPSSVYNWTTAIGAFIAAISLFLILFFIGISFFFEGEGAYLGLLTYMVLPVFLVLGLLLIPIGMWRKVRRFRRGEAVPEKP